MLAALEKKESISELFHSSEEDGIRVKQLEFSYLDKANGLVSLVKTDITAAQQQQFEQEERLREALAFAERANEEKTTFLAGMSHDMRTPLNGVISFTGFALKADTMEKKQEYLGKAMQSASILMGLINDTLEVSRIESGKMELRQEWTGLCELVDGITLVIQNSAAEKGLSFVKEVGFSEDDFAFVDQLKIQDLLMNLLTNAVRYTPEGGTVSLSIMCAGFAVLGRTIVPSCQSYRMQSCGTET